MVFVFFANGFEEIEGLTVVDVLRRAGIDTKMVSINQGLEVEGVHGIKILADCLVDDVSARDVEMVVMPGGMPGSSNLADNEKVQGLIKYAVDNNKWVGAICAAPAIILGSKGHLHGKEATCFPGLEDKLAGAVAKGDNVVRSGNFITSKGPATALEFAYMLVSVLKGQDITNTIKKDMLYKG